MGDETLLTPKEVADRLKIDPVTLRVWRNRGQGPKSMRLGYRTVRYRNSDVDAWLNTGANK